MTLYERADFALYHAKQNGRGRPVIFSEAHQSALRRQGILDQAMRKADFDTEMSVVFQPLFDAARNKPIAFEALARWNSPELGEVAPSDFIPVAERSELISKLTHTLLRKALETAATWPVEIGVTFNLSVRDLISPASILQIISIVNRSDVHPGRIDFEVTESALLMDFEQAQDSIQALKALGARISLDDFGTGYSSLSYVHRLPLDKIKIDRSFVTDIETKEACRNIVKTVVGLCRDLNVECVVEGMETEEQTAILRGLGCNSMQGYYFSRPLHGDCVDDLLHGNKQTDIRAA
jgi:predicted signal transduction protein with EAL and GGDEF domain